MDTQTITSTLVTNYGYDNANRLTNVNGVTYSWDNNGNLLSDGSKSYGYDQANRLKQVVQGALTTTLAYNGVGDRLSQTVGAATTHYVLDPAAGLTQVLADGTNTYLYGNDRLAQYQAGMQYFGPDALGSVRQIYDASGQVVGNSRYDPYGNVMAQSGATSVFAFAGEQYDAGTGLEYLRARYYSSAQGRFTTRDVWAGDPDAPMSYNAWLYVNGNPVNRTDPSGECDVDQCPQNYKKVWTPNLNDWLRQVLPASVYAAVSATATCTATPGPTPAPRDDAYELAKMMFYEERSEGHRAMVAVGWVAVNSIGKPREDGSTVDPNFPATLKGVLADQHPGPRFQGYFPHKDQTIDENALDAPTLKAWKDALETAPRIIRDEEQDLSLGAKYFCNNCQPQMKRCERLAGFWSQHIDLTTVYVSNRPSGNCPDPTPTPGATRPATRTPNQK